MTETAIESPAEPMSVSATHDHNTRTVLRHLVNTALWRDEEEQKFAHLIVDNLSENITELLKRPDPRGAVDALVNPAIAALEARNDALESKLNQVLEALANSSLVNTPVEAVENPATSGIVNDTPLVVPLVAWSPGVLYSSGAQVQDINGLTYTPSTVNPPNTSTRPSENHTEWNQV